METWHDRDGTSVSKVTSGMLTNGQVMLPVNGTVKRYKDGRLEVDGVLVDWAAVVAQSQQALPQLKLPDAMPNEPLLQEGEKECVICVERGIKTVITDCGHAVYCVTCARATVKQGTLCPLCRTAVTGVIRVYQTQ